jgi:hypothetical protein
LTRTIRDDRTDALRELKALAARANLGPSVGARTTMAELFDVWFERGRGGWSPTTVRNLASIVERHLKPALGHIPVGDLTATDVDEFYVVLILHGRLDGKPMGVGTVRRVHSTLHAPWPRRNAGTGSTTMWRIGPRRHDRGSAATAAGLAMDRR